MYGVEAAVILIVILFVVVSLLTAPFWSRLLINFFLKIWHSMDRASNAIDKKLGNLNESAELLRDPRDIHADEFPEEEK